MGDLLEFAYSACVGIGYALGVFLVVACAATVMVADRV